MLPNQRQKLRQTREVVSLRIFFFGLSRRNFLLKQLAVLSMSSRAPLPTPSPTRTSRAPATAHLPKPPSPDISMSPLELPPAVYVERHHESNTNCSRVLRTVAPQFFDLHSQPAVHSVSSPLPDLNISQPQLPTTKRLTGTSERKERNIRSSSPR